MFPGGSWRGTNELPPCGKDGRYWNDTIDPKTESKLLFYLCKDCQKKLFSMIGGFLEAKE